MLQIGHKYITEITTFNVQRALTPKVTRVTVFVFCTSFHDALHLCGFIKISGTVFNLHSGHKVIVEMAIFKIYCVQRAATPKVG